LEAGVKQRYVTIPEAMRMLSMSRRTFYRYVMPQIPVLRVGRTVRIPLDELETWAQNRTRHTL
jgi:excisionase family DNA binding protein